LIESFDRSQKTEATQKALQTPSTPELSEDQLMAMVSQESVLKSGAEIFKSRCVSCHGAEGEGIVGPNLTDDYWIHGGRMTEIVATITNGVPAKGMVPWKSMLSADEIHQVAAFVKSIRGQKVKNPKAPEGTLVTP
jgi:cytochrome c oxidase cbb3-type subunit 3